MTRHLETRLEIKSWDENPYQEFPDGRKLSQASVALTSSGADLAGEARMDSLLYYAADGTSRFVALMHLQGRLGDRAGEFVLQGDGEYDGTEARVELTVVPGSGTGELAGIAGTATSVSTHADYPHMPLALDYQLA